VSPIYEFSAFLRVLANSEGQARLEAEIIADHVSKGEATLGIEDSEPVVEED
jgi:hypothetical protein